MLAMCDDDTCKVENSSFNKRGIFEMTFLVKRGSLSSFCDYSSSKEKEKILSKNFKDFSSFRILFLLHLMVNLFTSLSLFIIS